MLAFVTGATGFLGSHVARALADEGAALRLLVRQSSNTKNIQDLKAELNMSDGNLVSHLEPRFRDREHFYFLVVRHALGQRRTFARTLKAIRYGRVRTVPMSFDVLTSLCVYIRHYVRSLHSQLHLGAPIHSNGF